MNKNAEIAKNNENKNNFKMRRIQFILSHN